MLFCITKHPFCLSQYQALVPFPIFLEVEVRCNFFLHRLCVVLRGHELLGEDSSYRSDFLSAVLRYYRLKFHLISIFKWLSSLFTLDWCMAKNFCLQSLNCFWYQDAQEFQVVTEDFSLTYNHLVCTCWSTS